MANLSNINNKFIVTDGNNGRVLIGATNDIGATLFANHPSTTAPSLTFNAPAGQVFENEDLQIAFGLNNASPYNGYMQTRFVSAPYYRNLAINPLGGNVGIGTNSPDTKLDVNGEVVISPNTDGKQTFKFTTNAADDGRFLIKSVDTVKVDIQANGDSYFNGGNVGIGVASGIDANLRIDANSATLTQEILKVKGGGSGGAYGFLVEANNGDDLFKVNTLSYESYFPNGNVGIGVASLQPWARLQVAGTAGAQTEAKQALYVTSPSTTAGEGVGIRMSAASGSNEAVGIIGMVNNASGNSGSMTFHTYNAGGDIPERMRIDNVGNVGIGTDSPDATLHVDASGGGILRISRLSASTTNYMQFENDGTNGTIRTEGATIFRAGGSTERMRILSGGDVCIGTTTPSSNNNYGTGDLNVENDTFASAQIFSHNSTAGNYSFLGIGKSSGTGASPTIVQAQETVGAISYYGYDGAAYQRLATISADVDGTPGAGDMPGRLEFSTTADGASTPTERMRITSSGNVTKPNSCAFSASTTTPGFLVTSTDSKITYNTLNVDTNNNYNTTLSRFTAPVTGNYLIGTTNTCYISTVVTQYMAVYIVKNGSGTSYRFRGGGVDNDVNDWFGINGSVIIPLAQGDYIELFGYTNTGSFQIVNTEGHFYGYLIG